MSFDIKQATGRLSLHFSIYLHFRTRPYLYIETQGNTTISEKKLPKSLYFLEFPDFFFKKLPKPFYFFEFPDFFFKKL